MAEKFGHVTKKDTKMAYKQKKKAFNKCRINHNEIHYVSYNDPNLED